MKTNDPTRDEVFVAKAAETEEENS